MKKLIYINVVLIILVVVIPNVTKNMTIEVASEPVEEVVQATEVTKVEGTEVTSRGGLTTRIEKNTNISYDMDLRTRSYLTEEDLEKAFKGTAMAGLGKYFIEAENTYGINAIYLASLGIHESAWGTSDFAKNRNNLFGWQAYDSNLNATKYFESKEAGILYVAKTVVKNYLTDSGCYFNGYTMKDISKRYASDPGHPTKIYSIMKTVVSKI